jgi:hypothetical protein
MCTVLNVLLTVQRSMYVYQYIRTDRMHCWYAVYCELTVSTCFEHYLLIFRRRYINSNWYTVWVFCRLAATRVGVPLQQIVVYATPPEDE